MNLITENSSKSNQTANVRLITRFTLTENRHYEIPITTQIRSGNLVATEKILNLIFSQQKLSK